MGLTKLEQGIFVKIDPIQYELMKEIYKSKILEKENYPDFYKEIEVENEVARYLLFRFILDDK